MDFFSIETLSRALDLLFPPRNGEHLVRITGTDEVRAHFSPTVADRCEPNAVALARFRTPLVRTLVHEAKFQHNLRAHELLGVLLADYLDSAIKKEVEEESGFLAARIRLVPVPLSRSRMRERGFNQSEAIARKAIGRLDTPIRDRIELSPLILSRVRDTEHQTALTRAGRRANVLGAFRANGLLDPAHTYIVFDDVLTTGATLQAAIDALRDGGAVRIIPLALAH